MNSFVRLFLPEKSELLLYMIISIATLSILNIQRFWDYVDGTSVEQLKYSDLVNANLQTLIYKIENTIIPAITDFIIWGLIGLVIVLIFFMLKTSLDSAKEHLNLVDYINQPDSKSDASSMIVRSLVRIISIIGLVIYGYYFLTKIGPELSKIMFTSVISLNSPSSWLWLGIVIIGGAISIYIFAIMLRLITLKVRVFN